MKHRIAALLAVSFISPTQATDSSSRAVYRCETPQGIVFADRPCDVSARPYEPDLAGVSVIETAVPVRTAPAKATAPAPRPRSVASNARPKAETCDRLRQSLRKVAASLRSGYGVKEGERLKERKRELEAKRKAARC